MVRLSIIVGTRPEIIKMSPIIRQCEKLNLDYFILHTGQHYSHNLDVIFFKELNLPLPKYNINCNSNFIGNMIEKLKCKLSNENPDIILIEGDTHSVLASAVAASQLHIKIGHVEAGLRSFDNTMPEEINRIIVDHMSDLLFVPTKKSKDNCINENIDKDKVFVVGNTIVDSIYQNIKFSSESILNKLNINNKEYVLITLHRQENVDNKERLCNILKGLSLIYKNYSIPIVYPIHPRTKKMIEKFNFKLPKYIKIIEPVGYFDFLQLEKNASIILTDSGGIQEEACILNVPCVTLRYNTERPETLDVGSNILVGTEEKRILDGFTKMIDKKRNWINPFGDGNTAQKILELII